MKQQLVETVTQIIAQRMNVSQTALQTTHGCINSETKGSAGNQYKTSRAKGKFDRNTYAPNNTHRQGKKWGMLIVNYLSETVFSAQIMVSGALVKTTGGLFWIAVNVGKKIKLKPFNKPCFIMRLLLPLVLCLFSTIHGLAQESQPDSLARNEQGSSNDQDPNYAQVADADQDSIQRFHVRISADGMASKGNIERVLLQVNLNFDWKPSSFFKLSSSPSYVYGRQAALLNERELFGDLRATLAHQRRVYGLVFTSWEQSNLRQIVSRWVQAAGVGFKIIQKPKTYVSITNVILHESTNFTERTDVDLYRNSTRLTGEFALDSRLTLASVVYFQPALTQKNLRWAGTMSLNYRLNRAISLRTKFENSYESLVVAGRQNNDFRWTMGLIAEYWAHSLCLFKQF